MTTTSTKLTGKHAFAIFGGAFAVIISVNIALAVAAVSTFPGIETRNAYIASQSFDARRKAQEALGWQVTAQLTAGEVVLRVLDAEGAPVKPQIIKAVLGRATHVADDVALGFVWHGDAYRAPTDVPAGNWTLRLSALTTDGVPYEQRVRVLEATP